MKVWWVNQGTSYEASISGGYLWAPLKSSRGRELVYWAMMREVRRGDLIVNCRKGQVVGISIATSDAYYYDRPPAFQSYAWERLKAGRRIDVDMFELYPPIPLPAVSEDIQRLRISQGPLNKNGHAKQSYLHRFSIEGIEILRKASKSDWPSWVLVSDRR